MGDTDTSIGVPNDVEALGDVMKSGIDGKDTRVGACCNDHKGREIFSTGFAR